MSKHTGGKWKAFPAEPDGDYFKANIRTQSQKSGLDIQPAMAAGYTKEEAEANASLIAQSPRMLEACKKALECFRAIYDRLEEEEIPIFDDSYWPLTQLRTVIKEAEGD